MDICINDVPTMKFKGSLWQENREERYQIVDDLIENHKLKGKNKSEIIDLLGSDSDTAKNDICILAKN